MFKNYLYDESTYLMSEFTIGFELEAWIASEDEEDYEKFKEYANNFFEYGKDITPLKKPWGNDPTINPYGIEECPDCEGQGYFTYDCHNCNGSGLVTIDCPDCDNGIIECPDCNGTGKNPSGQLTMNKNDDGKFEVEDCERCKGKGEIECPTCNGWEEINSTCPECDGTGEDREECQYCGGTGEYSPEYYGKYETFEWGSPIFKFIPKNIQKIVNFLDDAVSKYNVETNETCGFHIHIGFPEPSKKDLDMFWVLCQLATEKDNKQFNAIKEFKGYSLSNKTYATFNRINDIKKVFMNMTKYIKKGQKINPNNTLNYLEKFYNDLKYTILRMHPQGTLEWRGARGLLDRARRQDIKDFLIEKLYVFIKWMGDALDKDYIEIEHVKISRKIFDDYFSKLKSPIEKKPKRFSDDMDVKKIGKIIREFPFIRKMKFIDGNFDIVDGKLCIYSINVLSENTIDIENANIYNFYSNSTVVKYKIKNCNIYNGNYIQLIIEDSEFKKDLNIYVKDCDIINCIGELNNNSSRNKFENSQISFPNSEVFNSIFINCNSKMNYLSHCEIENSKIILNSCINVNSLNSKIKIIENGKITDAIDSEITGNNKNTVVKINNAEKCIIDNCSISGTFTDCTLKSNTDIYNNTIFSNCIIMGDVYANIQLKGNSKFRGNLMMNGESSIQFEDKIIKDNVDLINFLKRNPQYV